MNPEHTTHEEMDPEKWESFDQIPQEVKAMPAASLELAVLERIVKLGNDENSVS